MEFLERQHWVAWLAVPGVGSSTLKKLLLAASQLQLDFLSLWHLDSRWLTKCGLSQIQLQAWLDFRSMYSPESYWERWIGNSYQVMTDKDLEYPELLRHCSHHPALLFIFSAKHVTVWPQLTVAVVGTRKMTPYGLWVTETVTQDLIQAGASIVSGFMTGVDVAAHQTAIALQGHTIGVLGYGFNYLKMVDSLAPQKIIDSGGMLISEFPPTWPARKAQFPMRNRIIAGLSHGTLVTEAALKSGSLITANWAVTYGRTVFAVPAAITHPYSEGTRWLLNQGATLIANGQEIVSTLAPQTQLELLSPTPTTQARWLDTIYSSDIGAAGADVLSALQASSLTTQALQTALKISPDKLAALLTELEMKDLITAHQGQWFLGCQKR